MENTERMRPNTEVPATYEPPAVVEDVALESASLGCATDPDHKADGFCVIGISNST